MFGVAAGLIVAAVGACASSPAGNSLSASLIDRLEASPRQARFEFQFRAGGTRVNDCFFANPQFFGQVDGERELLVIRRAPDGPALVVSTAAATFLNQELFAEGAPEWIRVRGRDARSVRALSPLLGADLAAYAAAAGLPPDGNATALAALKAAKATAPLGASTVGGRRVDGFRVTLERNAYARAGLGSSAASAPAGAGDDPPAVELWTTGDGFVARIAVTPTVSQPGADEDGLAAGWILDYERAPEATEVEVPSGAVDFGPEELAALSPRRLDGCALPL